MAENVTGPFSSNWSAAYSLAALQLGGTLLANGSGGGGTIPAPANCVQGSDGPMCSLCLPGYALQSGECAPCDPADEWTNWNQGSKAGLLVACLLFAIVFIAFAFFKPIVPALERVASDALAAAKACFGRVKRCGRPAKPAHRPLSQKAADAADKNGDAHNHDVKHRTTVDSDEGGPRRIPSTPVGDARTAAVTFEGASAAAAGVGAAVAAGSVERDASAGNDGDSGGDLSDADASDEEVIVDDVLDFMDELEDKLAKLGRFGKIVVNFWQGKRCSVACRRCGLKH